SSVTLYLGDEPTVIDSGSRFYRDEVKQRISQFINPLDITCFIATHYHHDHLDNSDLFKNARRILDHGCVTPEGVMTVYHDPTEIPVPDDIEILATPGHVKNHISAKITVNQTRYICAGDAIRSDILSREFMPDYVDETYIDSARKVYNNADIIIPGHGDLICVDAKKPPPLIS
ncbi:MBL fold metallo-hydrolase, partial [bacterium]|nr:MBL fold metallo-hydrolase [bacterium]MBU1025033.1 MBL fold metallo-hydrolase [bacterium]